MGEFFIRSYNKTRDFLQRLSFRTGVIVLALCIPFYVLSFAQMALPLSATTKSALWVLLFGLAKTAQYTGLAILGIDGWHRVKGWFKKRKIKG
jgi:phosphoglycolate phosphatase